MALSAYRLMWMMVMFDLPVSTKAERKAATGFRNFLLDEGFEMSQFSVYLRFCAGAPQVEARIKRIRGPCAGQGQGADFDLHRPPVPDDGVSGGADKTRTRSQI